MVEEADKELEEKDDNNINDNILNNHISASLQY